MPPKSVTPRSVLIDVGAGLRHQYKDMLNRDTGLIIHAIALIPIEALTRVFIHSNFVISDRDTDGNADANVYIDQNGDYSLLPFNVANVRRWKLPIFQTKRPTVTSIVRLPTKTLETFINDIQLNGNITLININVQGYASTVLAGITTKRTWSVIKEIAIKVHTIDYDLYVGQTKLTDVMDTMLIHNFTVQSQSNKSQNQETVICFRNQTAVDMGWPFKQYGLGHLVLK